MSRARIYLSPPHMSGSEEDRIAQVFASNWVAPVGPDLARFEEDFAKKIGVEAAAAVSSGTAALHLALRRLELEPEDEVLSRGGASAAGFGLQPEPFACIGSASAAGVGCTLGHIRIWRGFPDQVGAQLEAL